MSGPVKLDRAPRAGKSGRRCRSHTRQLDGKLREVRFFLGGRPTRITYWIAPGRRITLFTVFAKSQRQERREVRREVRRAKSAMERCAAEAHTIDEE